MVVTGSVVAAGRDDVDAAVVTTAVSPAWAAVVTRAARVSSGVVTDAVPPESLPRSARNPTTAITTADTAASAIHRARPEPPPADPAPVDNMPPEPGRPGPAPPLGAYGAAAIVDTATVGADIGGGGASIVGGKSSAAGATAGVAGAAAAATAGPAPMRAAPSATAAFGLEVNATGRPSSARTISAASGMRDEPPTIRIEAT